MSTSDSSTNMVPPILSSRHPSYLLDSVYWYKWRQVYNAGPYFRSLFLQRFSTRETIPVFNARRDMSPIPAFASAAINNVRDSVYQRLSDVTRKGGSIAYQNAVQGLNGGVDHRGATLNYFLGHDVLTDLLVLGKAGIFVDMPSFQSTPNLNQKYVPYLYAYPAESILNFSYTFPEAMSEFQSVLLRDTIVQYDQTSLLPIGTTDRYRLVYLNENGRVTIQFYNTDGSPVGQPGNEAGDPIETQLTKIPFVMLDIGAGLMKNIADHQIALLNLRSADISYAMQANFPFYVEQKDKRAMGDHLKKIESDGTATAGGQGATDAVISTGVMQGRYYGEGLEAPAFINPSSEPLEASMKLQSDIKDEIRQLLNLSVQELASRASEGSKQMDNQGLESGLSYIGLVLENAERKIADYWSAYEQSDAATIKYPETYDLKTNKDRYDEADTLQKLADKVSSPKARRELTKNVTDVLLGGRVPADTMKEIHDEIDNADWTTSDPETVIQAHQEGLVGDQLASQSLGYPKDEYKNAQKDRVTKAAAIAKVQQKDTSLSNPAARGVPELSANPAGDAKAEKDASQGPDDTRGPNKFTNKE